MRGYVREYVREYVRACVRAFFAFLIGQICIDWVAMLLSITRIVLHYASTDVNGWPNPSCSFPDWLVSLSWRDLAGKQIFNSNGSSQTFVRFTRRKSGAKLHRRSEYRCIGAPPHVTDDDLYTVLTFSTHEWWELLYLNILYYMCRLDFIYVIICKVHGYRCLAYRQTFCFEEGGSAGVRWRGIRCLTQ